MKKLIILIAIVVIAAVSTYILFGQNRNVLAGETAQETVPEIAPVKASSEVVADAIVIPIHSAALSLPASGTVTEVLVSEGENVVEGQILLRLESTRQVAAVAQAEAKLQRAQAQLDELLSGTPEQEILSAAAAVDAAQARLDRIQTGPLPEEIAVSEAALAEAQAFLQKTREGPGEQELIAAEADVANAAAVVRQAQAAYDRVADKENIGARPESVQLEQATTTYQSALARLEALKKNTTPADIATAQARVKKAQAQLDLLMVINPADVAAAEAEVRQLQAQLDLLKVGARPEVITAAEADVAAARAALVQAQADLGNAELRAPFNGTIASINIHAGEQANAGNPIIRLADFTAWQIETDDLTELNIVRVQQGDSVTIKFDAIADLELTGKVVRSEAIGENKQGDITYTVVVAPDRHDERLRWNMTASVLIETD